VGDGQVIALRPPVPTGTDRVVQAPPESEVPTMSPSPVPSSPVTKHLLREGQATAVALGTTGYEVLTTQ
jgi:hypothetical protein